MSITLDWGSLIRSACLACGGSKSPSLRRRLAPCVIIKTPGQCAGTLLDAWMLAEWQLLHVQKISYVGADHLDICRTALWARRLRVVQRTSLSSLVQSLDIGYPTLAGSAGAPPCPQTAVPGPQDLNLLGPSTQAGSGA